MHLLGAVAQLGERFGRIEEVEGSIPYRSIPAGQTGSEPRRGAPVGAWGVPDGWEVPAGASLHWWNAADIRASQRLGRTIQP